MLCITTILFVKRKKTNRNFDNILILIARLCFKQNYFLKYEFITKFSLNLLCICIKIPRELTKQIITMKNEIFLLILISMAINYITNNTIFRTTNNFY